MKHMRDIPLKNFCTYRIGGVARDIYFPESADELAEVVRLHRAQGRPYWIHGGGANTLFPDGEIRLPIISTSEMTATSRDGSLVAA